MSRTKNPVRIGQLDQFFTPNYTSESIVEHILSQIQDRSKITILEPAIGRGDICNVLVKNGFNSSNIIGMDICPREECIFKTYENNFLETKFTKTFDLIITNPPFNQAISFISKSLTLLKDENSEAWFLLRLNFLGAKKRKDFFQEFVPDVFVLHKRPHFIYANNEVAGSDNCEYAWFCWKKYDYKRLEGSLRVI